MARRPTGAGSRRAPRWRSGTERRSRRSSATGSVSGVRVRELASGESSTVSVDGVFVHVGRLPNTAWLAGVLALDTGGHVPTDIWMRTERPGLFAAGDVRANAAGQAVSAAGDGATAAVAAHRYLAERAG